ncbi:MAG TPA: NERD domain-containing protein [Pantanalinema sp.]
MAQIIVAGNPVNEFEKTVARTLGHLNEGYVALTNVILPGFYHKQSNIEIDIILVSTHAIYAIETKYWQGEVHGHVNQKNWRVQRDNNPPHQIENPLQRCEMKAKTLNTILSRWNSGLMGKLKTKALIVVPPHTPLHVENPTDIELVTLERLLPVIQADAERMRHEATAAQVKEISQVLVGSNLEEGECLPFENYGIVATLKRSPRSVSFKAVNAITERQVFIKKLISDVNLPPDKLALWKNRAVREARATAKLSHPNLVTILDVLEDEGNLYIISEWVEGFNLVDKIGSLSWREALGYAAQAAAGLNAAHHATPPVVHRNVTPASIRVSDEIVKVTNFSGAHIEGDPSIVFTEAIHGRDPAYSAPELFTNASGADPRSDVYGLGATLYHLVTGQKPESFISRTSNPPAHELNPQLPEALGVALARAMQPLPASRFATMQEFREALRAILA